MEKTDKMKNAIDFQQACDTNHLRASVWGTRKLIMNEYNICRACIEDLQDILQLQYLAYQSEAALFNKEDIPPLKQTLDEVVEEFYKVSSWKW